MTEFNQKIYKTLSGVVKAINTKMKTLENLIDVKLKKKNSDSDEVKREKKAQRNLYREEFNELIDDKYKYEEQLEIYNIKQEASKKQKLNTKKVLGNLPATENAMYKNAKTKKEIRTQNRIDKENEINNNYGIVNKTHKQDRYALGKNFKQIFLMNNLPDEITILKNDAELKWRLKDNENKFKNNINYKIEQEYLNNLKENISIEEYNKNKVAKDRKKTKILLCHLRISYKTKKWDEFEKEYIINYHNFNSHMGKIKTKNNISSFIEKSFTDLDIHIEESREGSNFIFVGIIETVINIAKENRIEAGSFIETPKEIDVKKAVVNFKNMDTKGNIIYDDRCLDYCIIGSRYYDKINNVKNSVNSYKKYMKELKIPLNQTYPIDVFCDIPKYESINNIKINVWKLENGNTLELYMDDTNKVKEVINLLLIMGADNKNHFVWIKSLSRMFASKTTGEKKYMCPHCVGCKTKTQEKLDKHLKYCSKNEVCNVVLPAEGKNVLKFTNKNNEFQHPF